MSPGRHSSLSFLLPAQLQCLCPLQFPPIYQSPKAWMLHPATLTFSFSSSALDPPVSILALLTTETDLIETTMIFILPNLKVSIILNPLDMFAVSQLITPSPCFSSQMIFFLNILSYFKVSRGGTYTSPHSVPRFNQGSVLGPFRATEWTNSMAFNIICTLTLSMVRRNVQGNGLNICLEKSPFLHALMKNDAMIVSFLDYYNMYPALCQQNNWSLLGLITSLPPLISALVSCQLLEPA